MKTALITGVTGQDGAYLAQFLLTKGYEVYGTFRRSSTPNFWRLQMLGIHDRIKLISMDLFDATSIIETFNISKPDEVYHLAAQSFVGASFDQPLATGEMSGLATTRMLEALRFTSKHARFYQASTSELYGNSVSTVKNEDTPFMPRSPYAVSKLYAYWMTRVYREAYGLFACNGILFNHESPLRGLEFVTRKISNACARISLGLQDKLNIGNVKAQRDWGYAPDYVESMWMMLQQDKPSDYVVATGESHSVQEFIDSAFNYIRLESESHVVIDRQLLRPVDVDQLLGDSKLARSKLGWRPKIKFHDLVSIMVEEDLRRWRAWKNGEVLPWDAPLYPENTNIIVSRYSLDR